VKIKTLYTYWEQVDSRGKDYETYKVLTFSLHCTKFIKADTMCGLISACVTDCNVAVYDNYMGKVNSSVVLLLIEINKNYYIYFQMLCRNKIF
jgi:hypothetical protein